MNFGINSVKDITEFFSYIVTSFSLIGILITYAVSKKQIHFTAMEKCIGDFREFLKPQNKSGNQIALEYIDLVNEELFYLEKKYLPLDVCIEWVDGMIDYLPFYNNGNFIKSEKLALFDNEEITMITLNGYPRVLNFIILKQTIDFEKVRLPPINEENRKIQFEERNKLITEIISNLRIDFWTKIRLKTKVSSR